MSFLKSKLGIVLVTIFLVIIGAGMLAEELNIIQGESGPPLLVGFLFWAGLILSLPALIIASFLPIKATGVTGLSLASAVLYSLVQVFRCCSLRDIEKPHFR